MPNVHELNLQMNQLRESTPQKFVETVSELTELIRSGPELEVSQKEFARVMEMARRLILWNMAQFDTEHDTEIDLMIRQNAAGTAHCVEEKGSLFMTLKTEDEKQRELVAARVTYETLDEFLNGIKRTPKGLESAIERVDTWENKPPIFVISFIHTWDTGSDIGGYACQIIPKNPLKQYKSVEDDRTYPQLVYDSLEYEMAVSLIDINEGATVAEGIAQYPYTAQKLIWDTSKLFEMHLPIHSSLDSSEPETSY